MTPFHRTNLNLYTEDVEYMQRVFGHGWTNHVRDIIHQELKAIKSRTPNATYEEIDVILNEMNHDERDPWKVEGPTVSLTYAQWRRLNRGK